MGQVKNQFYKDFLDGFLLKDISRSDITKVLDSITNQHLDQARVLVLIAWATGARPNEYLRLTPKDFSRSTQYLEIRFPGSKGGKNRTISIDRYQEDGSEDPLTTEIHLYSRKLFHNQHLFWFFRSHAIRNGVIKRYKKKDGTVIVRKYDKKYPNISSKLNYYFPKWFDVLFPGGVPPYYLRHNRVIKVLDRAGREATIQTFGWEKEATLKHYSHKSKKMRKDVAKGLME